MGGRSLVQNGESSNNENLRNLRGMVPCGTSKGTKEVGVGGVLALLLLLLWESK